MFVVPQNVSHCTYQTNVVIMMLVDYVARKWNTEYANGVYSKIS